MSRSLQEERDFLLASLRDLEDERGSGEIAEDDYRALRASYTARAAEVLRRIQAEQDPAPTPPAAEPGPPATAEQASGAGEAPVAPRRRRRLKAAVAATGAALAGAGVVLVASGFIGSRHAGQQVTGSTPLASGPPADMAAARQAMAQHDFVDAVKLFDAVLAKVPDQPEALAYKGWLLDQAGKEQNNAGLVQQGLASIQAAVTADPSYPDAHFFLGMVLLNDEHDPAGAITQLQAYLATNPPAPVAAQVRLVLTQAQSQVAAQGATTTTTTAAQAAPAS